MNWPEFFNAFRKLNVGKKVGTALYIHRILAETLPAPLWAFLEGLPTRAGVTSDYFNVIKIELRQNRISLLRYPNFWTEGFPRLETSWTFDVMTGDGVRREYDLENNPPILHRKELLIPADHEKIHQFRLLTEAAEKANLFIDTNIIGRFQRWNQELIKRGLRLEDHQLISVVNETVSLKEESASTNNLISEITSNFLVANPNLINDSVTQTYPSIFRHKTAISRRTLSAPMQALWRHGFLDGRYSVFDYGCGYGDDVRALTESGLNVGAWDPHFRPGGEKWEAEVVNLGFVINVIEDQQERREALEGAFKLAKHVLSIATLIGGRSAYEKFRLFRDGVLTSIGTFQKYYTQVEFETYVKDVLGREPVTLAPGVIFVFKTDEQEQEFLAQRQRQRWRVNALRPMPYAPQRPVREPRTPRPKQVPRWVEHADLLEDFWRCCLDLGRLPEVREYEREPELREKIASPKQALKYLTKNYGSESLDQAKNERMGDTYVYLALNFFERRGSLGTLPIRLKHDIKSFWGSYKVATEEAQRLLFSVANTDVIYQACLDAAQRGLGYLDGHHSLQLHSSLVAELPPVLRIYLGCATKLYGDVEEADLLKIHIQSGKVSLMLYDDFENLALPNLIERVKINLRRQRIDFFEYGDDHPPQPLYLKSRYIYEDFSHFDEQKKFDQYLKDLEIFDFKNFGPPRDVFETLLQLKGLQVEGFQLVPYEKY